MRTTPTCSPLRLPALAAAVFASISLLSAANPVPNPSFENARGNRPQAWRPQNFGGTGTQSYADTGHTGSRSVQIESTSGADIGWAANVPVEPFARYRLSGWIKTKNVTPGSGRGALFNLHSLQGVATPAVTGTQDWTRVEVEFDVEDQDAVQVNCLFGGWGQSTGKAWYDDIEVALVARRDMPTPTIAIDATEMRDPISPYIYGQFIEHLGRCIYGGIWAEMLQDRKFYDVVGAAGSPWKTIGPGNSVAMVKESSFVGEHTPRIALSAGESRGLTQDALALTRGDRYVGHVWLSGSPDAGPVQVSLVWGDGPKDRDTATVRRIGPEYAKTELKFKSGGTTDAGRLEIVASGAGHLNVGTASLMPADNVQGMRADTLKLLRDLNSPVYRWPGGNFVSGYDWKDGIGDRDRRPPRKNPAWQGIEHNDFGLDEFLAFCRLLKTEPYIALNAGLGGVASAVEEVQYANGSPDTPMGRWRAENGNRQPYDVRFWGVGNEMYGDWQLGHMPLADYVKKHNTFATALRAEDPQAQLVAVGAVGTWSETMMQQCADHMDLVSEHFYSQERPGLAGHVRQIPDSIRRIADAHRRYRAEFPALQGKDIKITLDEWNYWYGPHVFGELGTRYFLKDGLGIAAGLNEYARQSDLYFMANYAQTVNVIGAIKTSKRHAAMETTGLVLQLYREHFGTLPVQTTTTGLIDAQAAWTQDLKAITLSIVNPTLQPLTIPLQIEGIGLKGSGQRWTMGGTDPQAYNDPDQPPQVTVDSSRVKGLKDSVEVGPCSVTLLKLDIK